MRTAEKQTHYNVGWIVSKQYRGFWLSWQHKNTKPQKKFQPPLLSSSLLILYHICLVSCVTHSVYIIVFSFVSFTIQMHFICLKSSGSYRWLGNLSDLKKPGRESSHNQHCTSLWMLNFFNSQRRHPQEFHRQPFFFFFYFIKINVLSHHSLLSFWLKCVSGLCLNNWISYQIKVSRFYAVQDMTQVKYVYLFITYWANGIK